ncbi:TPA: hypothetical protein ACX6PS_000536 [Photobacterium damselae]
MTGLIDFRVEDVISPNSDIIFILESPHHQEVRNGYPAAGDTGINMSKILFNKEEPIGLLLKEKKPLNKTITLMNSSRLPLQKVCYGKLTLPDKFVTFLNIRTFQKDQNSSEKEKMKRELNSDVGRKAINSFRCRLNNCLSLSPNAKLIVCGIIAQSFFEVTTSLQGKYRYSKQVKWNEYSFSVFYEAHPSSVAAQWTNPENMTNMLNYIKGS